MVAAAKSGRVKKPAAKRPRAKAAPKPRAKKPNSRPVGRPTIYSDELVAEICRRIMDGETIRAICADDDMPNIVTIFRWLNEYEEFSKRYAHAREVQADTFIDQMQAIADDSGLDVRLDEDGKWRVDGEVVQRSKLRVETRAKLAELLAPKKYGRKLEVSGEITHHHYLHLEHDELLEKAREKLTQLGLLKGE